ncbi:ent-kaurene oxidase [Colletotrichum tabaci]|uniref:Ent-kaurene oxidase n=1 Tax=Colletotrichum tabaci TaxID=1209068 RepID=A0AAV9T821_9PEZI
MAVDQRVAMALLAFAFLSSVWLVSRLVTGKSDLPLMGSEHGSSEKRRKAYLASAGAIYRKGLDMFRDKPYRLETADGERIVVPMSAMDELRRLPDDHLSMMDSVKESTETRYTGMTDVADLQFLAHVLRADLTPNLARMNLRLAEEVSRTVDETIGACEDWTSQLMYRQLLRIVAIASGNTFLGPELCRRDEYVRSSISYTVDVFKAIAQIKKWPKYLRFVGRYFTPELKTIAVHRRNAEEFLLPVIRQRRARMAKGEEIPDDLLQWMTKKAKERGFTDVMLADAQLTLSMTAIHTTTMAIIDAMCELVIRPDLVSEIRDEVARVLKEHGGEFTANALFDMKLLDSVIRESQRHNADGKIRFNRIVLKPIVLKDGTVIPKGYTIEAPYAAFVNDARIYPEPDTFNPYRFVDLREGKAADPIGYKSTEQYQFVTVTKENMGFGYGRHSCPGRFFAANEIKMILAYIMVRYDMRMPGGGKEKHPNVGSGARSRKDPGAKIEFKKLPVPLF